MLRFLLACSFAYTALATIGWDGIQRCDVGCFQCLKGNGYNFFIGRVWMSTGNHDDTGIQNVKDARAGKQASRAFFSQGHSSRRLSLSPRKLP